MVMRARALSIYSTPVLAVDSSSPSFERYPEDNASLAYGQAAPDPFGYAFPGFEYRNPAL